MKYSGVLFMALFFLLQASAQPANPKEKIQFSSINNFGILVGGSGQGATVQTINGIRYKNWNMGIGAGIDWYGVRSIPVVADLRRTFTNKKYKPFVYASGGVNFPWEDGYGYSVGTTNIETSYKNAFFGEAGAGYKIQLKNQTAILLGVGFSYKEIKVNQVNYQGGIIGFTKTSTSYEYYYRRIAIRMGFNF